VFEIGSSLREARQRSGLDFHQAEQAVKIRAKYLRALEEEDFDVLPAQTYVKGFLRNYADFLGLDGQLYVDEYASRFVVDEYAPRRARRVKVRRQPYPRVERNIVLVALAGIAVVTALIIAAWKFGGGEAQSIPNLPDARPAATTKPQRKPARTNLFVQAVRGSSLLQVRAVSATGRLLYQGTLERGQSQRFKARSLWLNVGSPENLWLRLNGRPVPIGGSCPRVLEIGPSRLSSSAHCG
jgi:Helix-turn-helix domain/RodZ C-terminal domain